MQNPLQYMYHHLMCTSVGMHAAFLLGCARPANRAEPDHLCPLCRQLATAVQHNLPTVGK